MLTAWAGPRYPLVSSFAERLDAWESAVEVAVDQPEPWFEAGDLLFHWGPQIGAEDAHERARAYYARAAELDSTFAAPLAHLVLLAVLDDDTAAVRGLGSTYFALGSLGDVADFMRWRVAHALADSGALATVRASFSDMSYQSLARILGTSHLDGIGLEDAERVAAALVGRATTRLQRLRALGFRHELALNQGRPRDAAELTQAWPDDEPTRHNQLQRQIAYSLYWDGDEVAGAEAASELAPYAAAQLARGSEERPSHNGDLCATELWRVRHGDLSTAARAIDQLRGPAPAFSRAERLCASVLRAVLAVAGQWPDRAVALTHLDSLLLQGGTPFGWSIFNYGNLILADLLEAQGDLPGALRVARRRPYHWGQGPAFLSSYLRLEGRLAAQMGDREGAIRAYRHYLVLRSEPNPDFEEDFAQARAELARLVGEPRSR